MRKYIPLVLIAFHDRNIQGAVVRVLDGDTIEVIRNGCISYGAVHPSAFWLN